MVEEITPAVLTENQFNATKLKELGYTAEQLKAASFDSTDLKEAGFTAVELRCAGFGPGDLRDAGFNALDANLAGFDVRHLKKGGYLAVEIKDHLQVDISTMKAAGYNAISLKGVGYHAFEMRMAGFGVEEIMDLYSPGELLRAGYTKSELKPCGLWPHDGEWQNYNQYWNCCFSLDKKTEYCAAERARGASGSLYSGSASERRPSNAEKVGSERRGSNAERRGSNAERRGSGSEKRGSFSFFG